MRYCKGCGAQLPDGAIFCPSCGRNVQADFQSESQNGSTRNFDTEYCQNNNSYRDTNYYNDTERYSALTILGMVFAFISSLVGLILSILAYNEAKRTGSLKNQSLSKTGIILSAVFLGLEVFLVVFVYFFVFLGILVGLSAAAAPLVLI